MSVRRDRHLVRDAKYLNDFFASRSEWKIHPANATLIHIRTTSGHCNEQTGEFCRDFAYICMR